MTLKPEPEASGQPESSASASGSGPTNSGNPVSAERLQETMDAVLPTHMVDGAGGAFTLFVHAFVTNLGFQFHHISQYTTYDGSRTQTDSASQGSNRLPADWNINRGQTVHEMIYTHPNYANTIFAFRVHPVAPYVHIVGHAWPGPDPVSSPMERLAPIPTDGTASDGQRIAAGNFYIPNYPPYSVTPAGSPGPVFRDDAPANLSADFQYYIMQRLLPDLHFDGYTRIDDQPPPRTARHASIKRAVDSILNSDDDGSHQCLCGASIPRSRYEGRDVDEDEDDKPPTRSLQEGQTHQAPPLLPEPASSTPLGPVIDDFTPPAAAPRPGAANVPGPSADFPPPGFEDEHQMLRATGPRRGGECPGAGTGFNPSIGADDLNPPNLGPHDPLRPSLAGGGLRMPGGNGGVGGVGDGSFGGMHPTFDDPLFAGIRGQGGNRGGGGGFFGPQNPPGARWDEPGPAGMDPAGIYDEFGAEGGMPQFPGGGRGGRGGFGRGGGFGGGFGGGGGGFGGFGGGSGGGGFGGFGGSGFA